jgi:prepilin-type N-terminal cleavage/methylation domain-containing protein
MRNRFSPDGFTLVEVIVAMVVVCTAAAGLAQLGVIATAQSGAVQRDAFALALAQSKIEELRALAWAFDPAGVRVSDPLLAASPPETLTVDTGGFVDFLDRFGHPSPPAAAAYHRRWAIAAFDPGDLDTVRLQSCVLTKVEASNGALPGLCVATVRTRRRP